MKLHFTTRFVLLVLILVIFALKMNGQQKVGVNTVTPVRNLEVKGVTTEYIRVQSPSIGSTEVGLELLLGATNDPSVDFKLTNDGGVFKILSGTDNFTTAGTELWRVDATGQVGIGATLPTSRLHIDDGEEASNTDDGFLQLGNKFGINTIFDRNEILARNNGAASTLYVQTHDGSTFINNNGGDLTMSTNSGKVGVGTTSPTLKLSLHSTDYQLHLRNTDTELDDWFIGASGDSWLTGGDHLLFSPTSSSTASIFRLKDVADNNGTDAPVIIQSSGTQALLLDGDEIDSKLGPLYINHNSGQNTYINPSGGFTGIGTSSPNTTLHIKSNDPDVKPLQLTHDGVIWSINPNTTFHSLQFFHGISLLAHVDGVSGQWVAGSDRKLKENIQPLRNILDDLNKINVYTYHFKHATAGDTQIGLIAQEMESIVPEVVHKQEDQYSIAYSKLSVVLIKAIQEQQAEIDALEKELTDLIASKKP